MEVDKDNEFQETPDRVEWTDESWQELLEYAELLREAYVALQAKGYEIIDGVLQKKPRARGC